MISTKGFLDPGPNGPRLTMVHLHSIAKAIETAIDRDSDNGGMLADLATVVKRLVATSLAQYPADRSCITCDFSDDEQGVKRFCAHWQQDVPDEAVDAGCDHHQEHGAPF